MRYTPKTPHDVRTCLGDCPDVTPVEIEPGVPVTAKTVAELRALSTWPPSDWVLNVHIDIPPKARRRNGWRTTRRCSGLPPILRPPVKFSPTNHLASAETMVQQIQNGRWKVIQAGLMF
jgi:hypothetical protein